MVLWTSICVVTSVDQAQLTARLHCSSRSESKRLLVLSLRLMGFDKYCLVCGGPDSEPFDDVLAALGKQEGDLAWLDEHLGITSDGPRQLGAWDESVNRFLSSTGTSGTASKYPSVNDTFTGISCHTVCYELLYSRLGYKLQLEDILPIIGVHIRCPHALFWERKAKVHADYGGMVQYQQQAFYHANEDIIEDCNCWRLLDPRESEQNAERILKVWTPLVKSFNQARREVFCARQRPMLTALYCSFSTAHQLAAKSCGSSSDVDMWTSMAKVPPSVVHLIAMQADFAWTS